MKAALIIAAASASLLSAAINAAEIKVVSTQATQEAYLEFRREAGRCGQGARQVPHRAGRGTGHQKAWPGARLANLRRAPGLRTRGSVSHARTFLCRCA